MLKITVNGNKVLMRDMILDEYKGPITIVIEGNVEDLVCNGNVIVNGNVSSRLSSEGSIHVSGDVYGTVISDGSVNIEGNYEGYTRQESYLGVQSFINS